MDKVYLLKYVFSNLTLGKITGQWNVYIQCYLGVSPY